MAPRKDSEINKDLNDIKESLNSICKDLNDLKNNRNEDKDNVKTLIAKVNDLEHLVKQKNDKIVQLEDRINDLEQYTRRDNLVISGLKIKKSYSRAVRNGNRTLTRSENKPTGIPTEPSTDEENQSTETQVIDFFHENGIEIENSEISACHMLKVNNQKSVPNIVVRFVNRKSKIRLLKDGKKLRGKKVYLNEHLTKKNEELAWQARTLRKKGKISATWTRNGLIYVKTHGESDLERNVFVIRNISDLMPYQ